MQYTDTLRHAKLNVGSNAQPLRTLPRMQTKKDRVQLDDTDGGSLKDMAGL